MRDWGNMLEEIVTKILEHVEFYEDFETLQKICRHWRLAAKAANFRANVKKSYSGDEHTLPWLMLPEKDECSTIRRLYSVSKKMVCHINLPHYFNIRKDQKRLLSSHGWLLVSSKRGRHVSLFNPYSNLIIKLPKIENYSHGATSYCKFTLSANPLTTCDFIVFVTFFKFISSASPPSNLVYWRNGDVRWIHVTNPYAPLYFGVDAYSLDSIERFLFSVCVDVTFYQGEFYGTNAYGWIVKFETAQGSPHFQVVANLSFERHVQVKSNSSITILRNRCYYYLVKSLGQLLIICQVVRYFKMSSNKQRCCNTRFEVVELNVNNGKVKEVSSLGNKAFFIGSNSSFSVEVSPSLANGFKPNCVYYTDICCGISKFKGLGRHGRNDCVYNLATRKFERLFYNGRSSGVAKLTPFTWVESPN